MRAAAAVLLAAALCVGLARLCSGVVYGGDSPVAYLVVKARPQWWIARPERDGPPVAAMTVLDAEEPSLFYEAPYLALMKAAPVLAALMALSGAGLLVRARRA